MITANKNQFFDFIFSRYNTFVLKRHFHSLQVSGVGHLTGLDRSLPMIFYANHSNWWDGLVQYYLSKELLRVDPFLMMEEKQMERYKFFRWLGVFSVDREDRREAHNAIAYAASLFCAPNRALWIFPQGVMKANDVRPLEFYPGIAHLAEALGRVQLIPVAHKYEFVKDQRPESFTCIGEPLIVEGEFVRKELVGELERRLTSLLDSLRCSVLKGELYSFKMCLQGMQSSNARFDRIRDKRWDDD